MATPVVRLRRSATQSAVPTTAQLALGEVAINTFDGKLFIKKDNGTESIVEIGAGAGGGGISNVVEDTTPQLGGDLDSNGNNILLNDDKIVLSNNQNFLVGSSTTTGAALTTGTDNILIGDQSGESLTSGVYNISIGQLAGSANTDGNQNISIGRFAGLNFDGAFNNVFIGVNAGGEITSASYNVCIGEGAGEGANSGATGNHNVFLGYFPSPGYTTGSENVSIGYIAGPSITEGQDNVSIGTLSGNNNTTGSSNIFIGKYGGISTTASNKVIIGNGFSESFLFDAPDTTSNEQLAIGNRTSSGAANYWIVGDENYNVGIGIDPTEKLDVQGNIKATSFIKSGGTASQYLMADGSVSNGGENYFQSTAPTSPSVGDRWVDSDDGICYVYYNDGNSSQWIEFGSSYTVTGATEPAAAQETISSFLLMGA